MRIEIVQSKKLCWNNNGN